MKHHKALQKICDVKRIRAHKAERDASAASRHEREAQAALYAASQERQSYAHAAKSYLDTAVNEENHAGQNAFSIREISDGYRELQLMADFAVLREVDHAHSHENARAIRDEQQRHFMMAKNRLQKLEDLLNKQQKQAATKLDLRRDDDIAEIMAVRDHKNATR